MPQDCLPANRAESQRKMRHYSSKNHAVAHCDCNNYSYCFNSEWKGEQGGEDVTIH